MQALLEYASYMPHGYCLFWQPWLVGLYAGSDLLIFLSYSMIPVALILFLRRRPDVRYRGLVALFAAFILLCGITHLVSLVTLWLPVYPLHGAVKLVTGAVSAVTAVTLFALIPKLVQIPSPDQLEAADRQLRAEVAAHEATFEELRAARRDLEKKVEQRTAELLEANRRLSVVSREAVHRGRNLLSVVSALAKQTGAGAQDLECFLESFGGRLDALSNATAAVMSGPNKNSAPLEAVVRRQLEPMLMTFGDRITIAGPEVEVGATAAQQVTLGLHELATNAMKFGALATPAGRVTLDWRIERAEGTEPSMVLRWRETGAPAPAATEAELPKGGFGTVLLTRAVPTMLQGRARRLRDAQGLIYELTAPLAALAPSREPAAEDVRAAAARDDAIWGVAAKAAS